MLTKIRETLEQLGSTLRDLFQAQRRQILLYLGGLLVLLLICLAAILLVVNRSGTPRGGNAQARLNEAFEPMVIPQDELFLPGEPQFLPEFLLGRERRKSWTEEDARPYWTDPGKEHSRLWRERIRTTIDDMLEGIP